MATYRFSDKGASWVELDYDEATGVAPQLRVFNGQASARSALFESRNKTIEEIDGANLRTDRVKEVPDDSKDDTPRQAAERTCRELATASLPAEVLRGATTLGVTVTNANGRAFNVSVQPADEPQEFSLPTVARDRIVFSFLDAGGGRVKLQWPHIEVRRPDG